MQNGHQQVSIYEYYSELTKLVRMRFCNRLNWHLDKGRVRRRNSDFLVFVDILISRRERLKQDFIDTLVPLRTPNVR